MQISQFHSVIFTLCSLTWAMTQSGFACLHADEAIRVKTKVLLYNAGHPDSAKQKQLLAAGSRMLLDQLILCGIGPAAIIQPSVQTPEEFDETLRTFAAELTMDETLLVLLLGTGMGTPKGDVLLGSDPTGATATFSVQRILDRLNESASRRQLLIIDGGVGAQTELQVAGAEQFGTGELSLFPGQSVILSRSPVMRAETTMFASAVADGLTELAELPGDPAAGSDAPRSAQEGIITGTELSQYLLNVAANYGMKPLPRVSTNQTEDFAIINSAKLAGNPRLSAQSRETMIDVLLQTAYQSLILDNKPEDAMVALQRALAYRPELRLRVEIIALWLTSLCADGRWTIAWTVSQSRKQPLLMIAQRGLSLWSNGRIVATTAGGEILEITNRQRGILTIRKVLRSRFTADGLSFDLDPKLQNLSLNEAQLQTVLGEQHMTPSEDEAVRLINLLRQIDVDSTQQAP